MYQLAFSNKTFYSNYGVFYDDLASVCLRMDHELVSNLVHTGSNYEGGSRMVSCFTLADPLYKPPLRLDDNESFEESMCLFNHLVASATLLSTGWFQEWIRV